MADERDVIRLRTNYRQDPPEDVYVYRVKGTPGGRAAGVPGLHREDQRAGGAARVLQHADHQLHDRHLVHTLVNAEHLPFSWKILASGHVPEYLYERGGSRRGLPFAELQRRAHVNARAQPADAAPDFSRRIRLGAP